MFAFSAYISKTGYCQITESSNFNHLNYLHRADTIYVVKTCVPGLCQSNTNSELLKKLPREMVS